PDLYLTALGGNHLFHNEGSGTFTEVTRRAGVGGAGRGVGDALPWGTSCAWFDYDRDGRLDLFVGNYCRWSPALNVLCPSTGGGRARAGRGTDAADGQNWGAHAGRAGTIWRAGRALLRPAPRGAADELSGHVADGAESGGLFQPRFRFLRFGAMFCDVDLDGR